MAETEYSQHNLASILTRLGNVESMLRLSVAANNDVKEHVESAIKARECSAQVYLLFGEGPLTQPQIEEKTGYKQANVSKICKHLVLCGLLARDSNPIGRGYIWRWSEVEEILSVSKIAKRIVIQSSPVANRSSNKGPS